MKIAVILFVGISIILSSCGNAENPYQNTSPTDGTSITENAESEKGNETSGTDIKSTEKNTDSAEKDTKDEENNSESKNQKNPEETSLSDSENQDKRKTEDKSGNQKDQKVREEPEKQAESEENRTPEDKTDQTESKGQSEPGKTEESSESSKNPESTESTEPQEPAEQKKSSETSEPQEKHSEDSGKTADKDKSEEKDSGNTQQSENEDFTDGIRTIFASGITKENFYDVNKLWDGNDTNLCWAATSSNLIVWWQDLYEKKGKTLPGKAVRDGNEIFAMFRKYKGDVSGTFLNGVPWYFVGNQSGNGGADGGFLLDLCGIEWNPYSPKAYSYHDEGKLSAQKDFSEVIISGLKKGAAGLKLHNRYDHAITLWGAEYDTSRNVNAIYVTDSDDRFSGIKRYEVFFDGKNIVMKNYDTSYNKITGAMFLYAP